ncbi:MAG TPA: sigma-70 family RNA polymerase sigma factor [Woeseiaceae bacterium]|nr:sigma-70 family RNA polymerase sigma factor [Woeseiaceae bacterium]
MEAALEGSADAFGELVERYEERLFRFLITRCTTRADAEDALQDTFFNAFRYLASYRPRWRFSTWLYRIAIRNAARGRGREGESFEDAPEEGADLLEQCIRDADVENLWVTARRLLPPDAFSALWLRYAEDMPVKEVARALQRSQPWTKVTLLRARNRLRAELTPDASDTSEGKVYG